MRHHASFAALLATLAAASPAFADAGSPGPSVSRSTSASYEVAFDDDPVHTLVNSSGSLVITGHGKGARAGLVRPRVQFVPELLKSVEAL